MPKAEFFNRIGVYARDSFLNPSLCSRVCKEMHSSTVLEPARVTERDREIVREEARSTRVVRVSDATNAEVMGFLRAEGPELSKYFGIELSHFEEPQYLRYGPGDYFHAHTDSSDHPDVPAYIRDRKVSLVLFMNAAAAEPGAGSFGGAEFILYDLLPGPAWAGRGFSVDAEAGLLVGFRSETLHEVNPVLHGERFTTVAWFH